MDEVSGFTLFWRIENFISKRNSFLQSPVFEIQILESSWQLGISERIDGYLSTYLYKVTGRRSTFLDVSVSLLTGSGWNSVSEKVKYIFKADGIGWGEDHLVSSDNLKNKIWFYMPSGSLTVSFHIWNKKMEHLNSQYVIISRLMNAKDLYHRRVQSYYNLRPEDLVAFPASYKFKSDEMKDVGDCLKTGHEKSKELKTECTQTDLKVDMNNTDDLKKLINEQKLSFVTLRTPGKEFWVPKAVLSAGSRVFAEMFERRKDQINCSPIDIDDIDSDTMALLINFSFTDHFDDLNWESTVKLHNASIKYEIDSLKRACVQLFKKNMCVENICNTFVLADMHKDNELMKCAMKYFCKNTKMILRSKEWKDLLSSNAELVDVILGEMAEALMKYVSED